MRRVKCQRLGTKGTKWTEHTKKKGGGELVLWNGNEGSRKTTSNGQKTELQARKDRLDSRHLGENVVKILLGSWNGGGGGIKYGVFENRKGFGTRRIGVKRPEVLFIEVEW